MLPAHLLKSTVNLWLPPSCCATGQGLKFSALAVIQQQTLHFNNNHHNHRCMSSSVSSSASKEDLEAIRKLAEEVDGSQETGVAKREEYDGSLIAKGPLPLITKRDLPYHNPCTAARQAWVENLDTLEEKKLGLVDLHPDVFGTFPRVEMVSANVQWQLRYKKVDWNWAPTRGEVSGPNSKPWPQKGTGRARHGDRRSPLWVGGGRAHGPRGPKTSFYMLPFYKRVHGLTSTLSIKLAQDDLKIVDNLEIPTSDPKFLTDLVDKRHWGTSVLFVDDSDIISKNIALATDSIGHMNIMPVYGLNVFSMLKHETLVLTLAAVNKIEEKLIFHLNRHDGKPPTGRKTRNSFV